MASTQAQLDKDRELVNAFASDARWKDDQSWQLLFTDDGRLVNTKVKTLDGLPAKPKYEHPLKKLYYQRMGKVFRGRWGEIFLPETASVWVLPDPDVYDVFSRIGQADRFPRFLLAGARARYRLNPKRLNVGLLVAGGSAPGLNQVIDSIVKRHSLLATFAAAGKAGRLRGAGDPPRTLRIWAYYGGYSGVLAKDTVELTHSITDKCALDPCCFLKCLRTEKSDEVIERVARDIASQKQRFNILYVIGGEGTHTAALKIGRKLDRLNFGRRPVIVAGPKTMDRDLHFADTTFGFQTTVDEATELILRMHAEAETLNRLAIVELFGANSGFVALHAAYASGEVDYVLIPEMMEARGAAEEVKNCVNRLATRIRKKGHAVLVVAEGASLRWVNSIFQHGAQAEKEQSFDSLTKHIVGALKPYTKSPKWPRGFGVFTNMPRHLIRSTKPNTFDIDLCKETGKLMVDTALAGFTDCSVNLWHGQYVLVPLEATTACLSRVDIAGYYFLSMWERYLLST